MKFVEQGETALKKAVVGIGLLISGTIGISTQRIVDTIFTANDCHINGSGLNFPLGISIAAAVSGALFCLTALKDKDR